jgi:chorismate synthase
MNFRFTTAGESHGKALVTIVEGLPSNMAVDVDELNRQLWRRQQGYGRGGRMKIESDRVEILTGVRHGRTLGSPVTLIIENKDHIHWTEVMGAEVPEGEIKNPKEVKRPRPGHADLVGGIKFQTRDLRDVLERASARETAARVAAGAVAMQLLAQFGIEIRSHVVKLGSEPAEPLNKTWEEICEVSDDSPLRCADKDVETAMVRLVDQAKEQGDTLGGIFEVVVKGLPTGLGSHVSWSEKLDGRLAGALMSIQAIKAVEVGEGVANASRFGSAVHDEITHGDEGFGRTSNRAGGLEGGITTGQELRVRGYMKPISTLRKRLRSVDIDTKEVEEAAFERSDITAVPAAGVIGEAMVAIVLANAMRQKFGGDSIEEMKRNFESYQASVDSF